MKYNYIIFGSDWDLYKISYSDVYELDNVKYIPGYSGNKTGLMKFLCKLHYSAAIYNYVNLPFKKIWNSTFVKEYFHNKRPLCLVFFGAWLELDYYCFFDYLNKQYPNARKVIFFQDLSGKIQRGNKWIEVDIEKIRNKVDLLISFDQNEAEEYKMKYHPLCFSSYKGCLVDMPQSDVYFLGKAKNRLKDIFEAYELLTSKGLICDFYLVEVNEQDKLYRDKIHYINNMPYLENIQHIMHTHCLLEIMQQNGTGFTQRTCEAIAFDKKLLTNNKEIINAPFYNPNFICSYKETNEISIDFLTNICSKEAVDFGYKQILSPIELLEFIEGSLEEMNA